jgi:hypothetical protein
MAPISVIQCAARVPPGRCDWPGPARPRRYPAARGRYGASAPGGYALRIGGVRACARSPLLRMAVLNDLRRDALGRCWAVGSLGLDMISAQFAGAYRVGARATFSIMSPRSSLASFTGCQDVALTEPERQVPNLVTSAIRLLNFAPRRSSPFLRVRQAVMNWSLLEGARRYSTLPAPRTSASPGRGRGTCADRSPLAWCRLPRLRSRFEVSCR